MGTLPGQSPLAYQGIREKNPPQLFIQNRTPTSADFRNVHVGDMWIDTANDEPYICTKVQGPAATWILMAGVGGDFNTFTADDANTMTGPDCTFTGNNGLETVISGTTLTYRFTPVVGFTGSQREFAQAALQTSDGSATQMFTITLDEDQCISMNCRITAMRDDYTSALVGQIFYGARRESGGAVEIGAPIVDILEDNASTPSIDAEVNGNDMRVTVTGLAGQTWNWVASYDYHAVNTNL